MNAINNLFNESNEFGLVVGDEVPLIEEDNGRGILSKIAFLLLLTGVAAAVGIIFFELEGVNHSFNLSSVQESIAKILNQEASEPAFTGKPVF